MAPKGWLQSILELHLVVGDTRRGLRVGFEEMENGLAVASVIWWPVWPLGGLSQNEIGRARISMMARSDLLHAGPDTEAQDQSYHSADSACNARPVHTVGSFASILACPRHVRSGGNLGSAGCPLLPLLHHLLGIVTIDTTLRLRGISSCCMDHLPHRTSRSWSARSKFSFLLRNSKIKLQPQQ